MTAMFYNTIISWAVYYLFSSFHGIVGDLPWKDCTNSWNTPCCVAADVKEYPNNRANLSSIVAKNCSQWFYSTEEYFSLHLQELTDKTGFENLGKIKWELALSLLGVFVFVYFALWKGIKSAGKVCDQFKILHLLYSIIDSS